MPFGAKPSCARCKNTQSTIWKKGAEGEIICNSCNLKKSTGNGDGKSDSESSKASGKSTITSGIQNSNSGPVRKSARLKPTKYKQYNPKAQATKGKSRRVTFKKNVSASELCLIKLLIIGYEVNYMMVRRDCVPC